MISSLAALNNPEADQPKEDEIIEQPPPETDTQQQTENLKLPIKTKLKEAAFGFPPAADIEELKEKLKERAEKTKKSEEEAKASSEQKLKESVINQDVEKPAPLEVEIKNVEQLLESLAAETLVLSDDPLTESSKLSNTPVTFELQPEEELKKSLEKIDPDMKFFFGSLENVTSKSKVSQPSPIQLNDPSQSVVQLVGHVQETAKKLLVDTKKVLEKFELHDDMFAMHQNNRDDHRETKELINFDENNEDEPEVKDEALEDPREDLREKILETHQELETFKPVASPKLKDIFSLEFEPDKGTLKFEKQTLLLQHEQESKVQNQQQEQELKVQDQQQEQKVTPEPEKAIKQKKILDEEWLSLPQNDEESFDKPEKAQKHKSSLRRSEAAQDLSALVTSEKVCSCAVKQTKGRQQQPQVVSFNEAAKMAEKSTGAIKKVKSEKNPEINQNFMLAKTDIVEIPKTMSVKTVSSLHQMVQANKKEAIAEVYEKEKSVKGDDDDGFGNLVRKFYCGINLKSANVFLSQPTVPSHELSQVLSSVWIDENVDFSVSKQPSVHKRAPLGQAAAKNFKVPKQERIASLEVFDDVIEITPVDDSSDDETTPTPKKKKESKLQKCQCFLKRMSKAFRRSKD